MSRTYITKQGDMWDGIAYTQLGDAAYTGKLMGLNTKHLGIYIFPAGIELFLPEIDESDEAGGGLPPWKKVNG